MTKSMLIGGGVMFTALSALWLLRIVEVAVRWWGPLGVVVLVAAVLPAFPIFRWQWPHERWLRVITASAACDVAVVVAFYVVAFAD